MRGSSSASAPAGARSLPALRVAHHSGSPKSVTLLIRFQLQADCVAVAAAVRDAVQCVEVSGDRAAGAGKTGAGGAPGRTAARKSWRADPVAAVDAEASIAARNRIADARAARAGLGAGLALRAAALGAARSLAAEGECSRRRDADDGGGGVGLRRCGGHRRRRGRDRRSARGGRRRRGSRRGAGRRGVERSDEVVHERVDPGLGQRHVAGRSASTLGLELPPTLLEATRTRAPGTPDPPSPRCAHDNRAARAPSGQPLAACHSCSARPGPMPTSRFPGGSSPGWLTQNTMTRMRNPSHAHPWEVNQKAPPSRGRSTPGGAYAAANSRHSPSTPLSARLPRS